jgi:RNA polymerase sigma factor (sigma-70 family)
MKEVRVEARIRNNILYRLIFDNYNNVNHFCRSHKLQASVVGQLLNLKISPLALERKKVLGYRKICRDIARIFNYDYDIERLFPSRLYGITKTEYVAEVGLHMLTPGQEQMLALPGPEDEAIKGELKTAMAKAMQLLTLREERVLRYRYFDGYTYEEAGNLLNVSKERIRQIEMKAIRRLRHFRRAKHLKEFCEQKTEF